MSSYYPTIADVSHHQGVIDWQTAKGYLSFVIVRVQDGASTRDRYLTYNIQSCENLGIPYHLYGFYRGGGASEAQTMIDRANEVGIPSCQGFVCDLETSGYGHNGVIAYAQKLAATGLKKGLYLAHNLYNEYKDVIPYFDWLWIPRYGANTGQATTRPSYACDLWQFTSVGKVPGINGSVDLNACMNKDLSYFVGEGQDLDANQAAQLQEIYHQVTRTDDPTGRGMENNDHDHIKWIAKAVQDNAAQLDKIEEAVTKLQESVTALADKE